MIVMFSARRLKPDAWEQFMTLKRQYFFEHEDGEKLLSLNRDDDAKFFEAVGSGGASTDRSAPLTTSFMKVRSSRPDSVFFIGRKREQ